MTKCTLQIKDFLKSLENLKTWKIRKILKNFARAFKSQGFPKNNWKIRKIQNISQEQHHIAKFPFHMQDLSKSVWKSRKSEIFLGVFKSVKTCNFSEKHEKSGKFWKFWKISQDMIIPEYRRKLFWKIRKISKNFTRVRWHNSTSPKKSENLKNF